MSKLKTQFNDLVEAPTPTPPLFSQQVNVAVPTSGILNLTQYDGKIVRLVNVEAITTLEVDLTLPTNIQVIFSGSDETIQTIKLKLGTTYELSNLTYIKNFDLEQIDIPANGQISIFTNYMGSNFIHKTGAYVLVSVFNEI